MKSYKYKNYDEYVKCQKDAFKKKYKNVWAKEENIKAIAEFIRHKYPINPSKFRGLCHGVRQGWEIVWFKKYLYNCQIIGTDIGRVVNSRSIIQHDFNMIHGFLHDFDFIYSNSFDHSYDPQKTLGVWSGQLNPGGLIILEYDRRQEHTGEISRKVNKTDPQSITFEELKKLAPKWAGGKLIKILDMPVVTTDWRKAMVIEV